MVGVEVVDVVVVGVEVVDVVVLGVEVVDIKVGVLECLDRFTDIMLEVRSCAFIKGFKDLYPQQSFNHIPL